MLIFYKSSIVIEDSWPFDRKRSSINYSRPWVLRKGGGRGILRIKYSPALSNDIPMHTSLFYVTAEVHYYCFITQTPDYLPSVSETTGDYQPGQFITRFLLSFALFPTMLDTLLCYNLLATQKRTLSNQKLWYRWLNRINVLVTLLELAFLYIATFVGLSENEGNHGSC